ncbi:MAG: dCTP deaminase [SAR202 cluster bacterium Io17-Chloro-G9]|nr:MAG: dCTP deaminase [SAR202 cluster bacterium Io17-Chloro-G9]
MRLSRKTIVREIQEGRLLFDPFDPEQIGVSSVDLRLGHTFISLEEELEEQRQAGADVQWRVQNQPWAPFAAKYGRRKDVGLEGFTLEPNKLVLGLVHEYIRLPPTLAGRVEGKSGPARRRLLIHLTAPTIQAGWDGHLQLELYNVGPAPIKLLPEEPICQLILEEVTEPEQYEGQFQSQTP